jgi:single-strand DNA-binding protein
MKDMNKIFIMGRLGADPTPKETKTGVKMVTFPVATSRWSKDTQESTTQWHRVVAWGKQSEQCATYLKKGNSVLIEGSVKTRKYPGKDGIDRMSIEVHADNVTFLSGARKASEEDSPFAAETREQVSEEQTMEEQAIA